MPNPFERCLSKIKLKADRMQNIFRAVGRTFVRQGHPLFKHTPKATLFDFLKKNKGGNDLRDQYKKQSGRQADAAANTTKDAKGAKKEPTEGEDDFVSKEQYMELLAKKRLEAEKIREEEKKVIEREESRLRREVEVKLNSIDYAQILAQNVNIRSSDSFKSVEELFYFIGNLRVKISEENLSKCLEGFLALAEKMSENDLQRSQYLEFLATLRDYIYIVSTDQTLSNTAHFGDLYCVSDPKFWKILEKKFLSKASKMEVDLFVKILSHFANQREGSDELFDHCEQVIRPAIANLHPSQLTTILQAYFNAKHGTEPFIIELMKTIFAKVNELTVADLVKISFIVSNTKGDRKKDYELLEKSIIPKIPEMSLAQLCMVAKGFGNENGSADLFKALETAASKELEKLEHHGILGIIEGFMFTYRASDKLLKDLKPRIMMFRDRFSLSDCARIVRAYHILEHDDPELMQSLERHFLIQMRNVDELKVEDIIEIAKTYTLTRTGSRELYKILELVIVRRLADIGKQKELLEKLYYIYTKSGLCSYGLLQKIELLM